MTRPLGGWPRSARNRAHGLSAPLRFFSVKGEFRMTAPSPLSALQTRPLLDTLKTPADLRQLNPDQLKQVADELREETVSTVAVTGGHLGASLGVIELTVALHYVFDTPRDKLIWDVGHQAYPHK